MPNAPKFVPNLFRSDAFFIGLSKYEEPLLKPFHDMVRSRIHTVGDTAITYRVINHWAQKNLLPEGCKNSNGTWHKFTTVELAWLRVVVRLRKLGLSLEKIASATEQVMRWDNRSQSYPIFEYCLALALASSNDPYVIFLSDGTADVATSKDIEGAKIIAGSRDMSLVSLKSILSELGFTPVNPAPLISLERNEAVLISKARSGVNSEITAHIKEGRVGNIRRTVSYRENPSLDDIKKGFKENGGFGEILLKVSGGVVQSAVVNHHERLS